jgi:hypothetical protein
MKCFKEKILTSFQQAIDKVEGIKKNGKKAGGMLCL